MLEYQDFKNAIDTYKFHGSEQFYKASIFPVVCTEGAQWFFENFECWWLHDIIAGTMMKFKSEPFMVVKCEVGPVPENVSPTKLNFAKVSFDDGNGNQVGKIIETYTDLPEGTYTIWAVDGTILLNTEY